MALQIQLAALVGFTALMIVAAFEDFRRLVIPNVVPLCVCLGWPLYLAPNLNPVGALAAIACAAIVFTLGALCFSRGFLGGGDVKLLTAATLWAGPSLTPILLVTTGALGGALALVLMVPPCAYFAALARAKLGPATEAQSNRRRLETPVPYGIAIAAAATLVIVLPHFR